MKYQEKIAEWVQIYLQHIQEVSIDVHVKNEEGYKFQAVEHFQKNFDLEAANLAGMLEVALINNNLVTGAQYWPRKMLVTYAQVFPEETRNALRKLFDESKDVGDRITEAEKEFYRLNDLRNKQFDRAATTTYIGLRFLSLFLGYRFPNFYNPLKPAEWKIYSRFLNPDFLIPIHTPPGEQYKMYQDYIEDLRGYIKNKEEIRLIKNALTKGLTFQDDEFRWMAQDVIYVTARLIANERSGEASKQIPLPEVIDSEVSEGEDKERGDEENTGFMPLEKHLEEYLVRNWDTIDFGERLTLYRDEDGAPGQQYATEVGIIDILAKDMKGDFVVIELKRAESGYKVIGQVLNYMGWVQDKLATHGQKVRGMIVVGKADNTLRSALKPVADKVMLKEYRVKMDFIDPK